jgi:hypothetical protein
MPCRVRYLNSAGIHLREIPGIDALAQALPPQWLLYASLQCYPPRSLPIEIDALVVAEDRVLRDTSILYLGLTGRAAPAIPIDSRS